MTWGAIADLRVTSAHVMTVNALLSGHVQLDQVPEPGSASMSTCRSCSPADRLSGSHPSVNADERTLALRLGDPRSGPGPGRLLESPLPAAIGITSESLRPRTPADGFAHPAARRPKRGSTVLKFRHHDRLDQFPQWPLYRQVH